ncbi:MAG: GTP-binding protein [Anaerovoracaceae bacterium]|nr:GTP-binding protein [Bacillota bacterium]MDY2671389.1 GTP-binding protein [Anaerovoracaceae bacterium]
MIGLLKFITCGSVDDGKSTLIGHLLYDAKLLYADQEQALELDSKVGSTGGNIDYSLLLDGLLAEREQGITIDVAYRYFTTDNRSFICADTPGHEEYTRNMACGASFADLAVILIDASQGVLVQTRRHARICALMGIRHFVFAVNKMDLVGYDEARFREIEAQIKQLKDELELKDVVIIPVSATVGDNITEPTSNFDWYKGPTLLHHLETVDVDDAQAEQGFYLPIQRVCRPNHEFRGFQGQIEGGTIRVGDELTSLPSGEKAHIRSILVADKQVQAAVTGQPVTVQLDREVDVSRGCVLESGSGLTACDSFETELLWMDDQPLTTGKNFIVKLGTKKIPGILTKIKYKIDINTGEHKPADRLQKNEIAVCDVAVTEPVVVDLFKNHRAMGELILIDRISHMTSACGVVTDVSSGTGKRHPAADRAKRASFNWQAPITVEFRPGRDGSTLDAVEEAEFQLIRNGRHTYLYHPEEGADYVTVLCHLRDTGLIILIVLDHDEKPDNRLSSEESYKLWADIAPDKTAASASQIADTIFHMTIQNMMIDSSNWII